MLRIAIIADDLTGANDSGVQLARQGVEVSVCLDLEQMDWDSQHVGAIVVDTNSRSLPPQQAYELVAQASRLLADRLQPRRVFKKLDSTLRGNIGAEIDAVYDTLQPDLVCIAPAYPDMKRHVRDGQLYVDGVLLHETEAVADPRTPVRSADVMTRVQEQSAQPCRLITLAELRRGKSYLLSRLQQLVRQAIPYVLFDSETNADLALIADLLEASDQAVVWCGSAGLASVLPLERVRVTPAAGPSSHRGLRVDRRQVLTVVGSLSARTRQQLALLLAEPQVVGVEIQSAYIVNSQLSPSYLQQLRREVVTCWGEGKHVVLFSSADRVAESDHGRVAYVLGKLGAELIQRLQIEALLLTGGDTARQVCAHLGVGHIKLRRELESGVPIGQMAAPWTVNVVTKAGGFGSDEVLCRALSYLSGGGN